ncbi:MAG: glycogen synthase GlgA [Planctomycetaceae bacterium]|nr:glycogen synthase GlgA [Planctomycetaceae bacterium]
MRILLVSSEAVPFAKTGGLADVATGLAKALASDGHEVVLALPCYRRHIPEEGRGEKIGQVEVQMRMKRVRADILETDLPESSLRVWLIDQPNYFDRASLYVEGGFDYADNSERFLFFSRAVLEAAHNLYFLPHIIHANDWQTGVIPAIVREQLRQTVDFNGVGSVFTIHNMAFHGSFPPWDLELTGLPQKLFNWRQMEFYGQLDLLKTGITFADMVTTVSPTYAREICRSEFGCGLDAVLNECGDHLVGILNGVDMDAWNPELDPLIPKTYGADHLQPGKGICKETLQRELELEVNPSAMLFGMVTRLTDQKGLDLIAPNMEALLQGNTQFVFLGTGDPHYEELLRDLEIRYPGRVSATIGFHEKLAHRIEAGADAYLMPSRFEPCGLNQQYSLLYGTVPIVHRTGGLADSVIDATPENLANGTATGFSFTPYTPAAFLESVWSAVGMFQHRQDDWQRLLQIGMTRDWSWNRSAREYMRVYERALERAKSP